MVPFSNRQQLLALLHTFSIAAKHLSFTLAAEELFLTQGGVSHRIKKLEKQLNFRLFVRQTRKLALTPEGERVLTMLNTSFELIFNELSDIQNGELTGEIYIATSPYFASAWLMPRLNSFRRLYPHLSIKLQTKQNQIEFQFDPYDVAIFYSDGHYPNHHSTRLFNGIRTPVCSPEYAKKQGLLDGVGHLVDANFIHSGDSSSWQHWLQKSELTMDCQRSYDRYSDNRLAIEAACCSMGVALGRYEFVKPLIEQGVLIAPFARVDSGKGYDLVCPQGMQHRSKYRVFSDWLHSQLEEVE
ncbi:LysR substrate-binding domain-containing protein [Vibrio nomapromontoriensis]